MKDFNHELLKRYLIGETNDFETWEVEQWLSEHGLSKEDVRYAIEKPDQILVFDKINPEKHWPFVEGKIKSQKKVAKISFIWRVAAAILILLSVTGAGWWYNDYQHRIQVVTNTTNHVLEYMLPDSTVVCLNTNSRLTYANNFTKKRNLTFEGLGFFKVKRNVHRPFVIATAISEVKVLGTSFTVSTSGNDAEVIVVSGKVAFYAPKVGVDTVFLEKGDKGLFVSNTGSLKKLVNNDRNFLAWEIHKLIFDKTPVKQVINDLERYYQVKIKVSSPDIYKLKYTSEFNDAPLVDILKEMEVVLNIHSKVDGNTIILTL